MENKAPVQCPKILILATLSGGYRGADAVGQSHLEYAPDTYILPVMSTAMFPPQFYLKAFEHGIDAIIIMYSGTDSPYKGEAERTGEIVNQTYDLMKRRGLDVRRLRLTAICTVCVQPFLREVRRMEEVLKDIGLVQHVPVPELDSQPQAVHSRLKEP
jgi:F420-non-reducing hydrogenase iron-sulfur subunit